jgi:M6 family metalloprotease-like protein
MNKRMRKILLLVIFIAGLISKTNAEPAYPFPSKVIQPDGTSITLILKGDERVSWAETLDGYTLLNNSKNGWEYATLDENGNLVSSGIIAHETSKQANTEQKRIKQFKKKLRFTDNQIEQLNSDYNTHTGADVLIGTSSFIKKTTSLSNDGRRKLFSPQSTKKLLMLLVQFSDMNLRYGQADFTNLMNFKGYSANGAQGSVRDYFLETSYNQFDITTDVKGPYRMPNTHDYYGADGATKDLNYAEMVTEAVRQADAEGVNFKDYDSDNDGVVDGVYVIFAGWSQAHSGIANDLWSKAGSIDYTATNTASGSTKIKSFSISNELLWESSDHLGLATIGVICHEFGHVCGAPDYYDTDYETSGQYQGTGDWDVMCGGNNNGTTSVLSGNTPAHFNPYTKMMFGWITPEEITTSGTYNLNDISSSAANVYKINTQTSDEYFLLENRQQSRFNQNVPGHGLMIYHKDNRPYMRNQAGNNNTQPLSFYPKSANSTVAIPTADPASYGVVNAASCPFPGSLGKTAFYDAGTPSAKSWAGVNTNMPITNITETSGVISFKVTVVNSCSSAPTTQSTNLSIVPTATTLNLSWTRGNGDKVLVVAHQESAVDFDPINGINYTANSAFQSGDEIGQGNFVMYNGAGSSLSVTGLLSGVNYHFALYEYNSTDNCYLLSPLTGNETTTCPQTSIPYTENFERNAFGCWTTVDNTGNGGWKIGTTTAGSSTVYTPAFTGNYAYINTYSNSNSVNADFISPTFDLTDYSSNIILSFNYQFLASTVNPATATLYYSTDGGTNWTSLSTFTSSASKKTYTSAAITALQGQSQVKFKWTYTSTASNFYWAIDDIQLTAGLPIVITVPVTGLTSTTAVSGGNITSIGASAVTAKGVCWSTSTNPTINDSKTTDGIGLGAYRSNITGLTANTLCYVRAYATNTNGTAYGVQSVLVTPPVSVAATTVTSTGFTANWEASSGATNYSLDVSSTPFGETKLYENFNGFTTLASNGDQTSNLNSYLQNSGWSGIAVSAYSLGYVHLNNSSSGQITTPTIDLSGNSGNYTAYLDVKQYDATATTMRVMHAADGINFTQVFYVPVSSAWVTQKVQISGGTSASKIKFSTAGTAATRIYLDNIRIEVSDMLTGYNNLAVSGTSQSVTIPTSGTYYYRVRANGTNSATISSNVVTCPIKSSGASGGNWSEASTWSPLGVPVARDNVVVASTAVVNINVTNAICNNLTIENGGVLQINPAKSLTVNDTFTNNAGNNGFILQSNATGTATFLDNGTANTAVGATVQQYLSSVRNWYMSSPVTGATAPAGNTYYKYVETANDGATWTPVSSGATFDVMTGYTVKPAAASTFTFSGALNTGAQSISSLTSTATAKTGYNLVGNPYPSYVNWMSATKTNLSTTIWYRTQNSATTPAYVFDTYNETANTGTNNNGVAAVTGMIPPMQAFWVKVNAGAAGTLAFDNSMRSHQDVSTNQFRAPAANATQQTLRLQVSNGTNIDEAIVLFNANAADGYDAYDSPKMTNANASIPEIYTFAGTEKAVINGLNSIATNSLVSLGFSAGAANTFSIKATEVTNFDADTRIVLKDKVLNVEQDITNGTPYNFTSGVTSTDNRFSVVFKSKSSITGIDNSVEKETIIVSKNANNQIVVTNNANTQTGVVMVSNAIGQRLYSAAITGVTTVVTKSFSPGVYLVTVNEGEKHVTKKVIIN